jgi:hypothetical protein
MITKGRNMKNIFIKLTSTMTFALALGATQSCDKRPVAQEKEYELSHNIFTGEDILTTNTKTQYKNIKTGKITEERAKKKLKYDK